MRIYWRSVAGFLLLALFGIVAFSFFKPSDSDPVVVLEEPYLSESDCWFDVPDQQLIRCGHLVVTDFANKQIQLPYVVIKDASEDHQDNPLVYVPGGPGSSSSLTQEGIEGWLRWLDAGNFSRDLVLMDQRGTGLSKPQFQCREYENALRSILKENLSSDEELAALSKAIATCIAKFEQQGFLFEQFSTITSSRDYQALLVGLGYQHWNVIGASYGTRVAMVWANNFNQGSNPIRSMILDSVYPPGKGGLLQWPEAVDKSFRQAWAMCEMTEECDFSQQQLIDGLNFLKNKPIEMSVSLWEGGWPIDLVLNDHRFLFSAYSALYRPSGPQKLSQAIDGLLKDDQSLLEPIIEASINSDLDPEFNPFTFFMIDCAENARPSQAEFDKIRAEYSLFENYTQQNVDEDVCQLFHQDSEFARLSKKFDDSSQKITPSLFLSGGLDPVTPARWVDDIQSQYVNGQVWLMPELSHGVSANSQCVLSSLRQFLDFPKESFDNPCATDGSVQ